MNKELTVVKVTLIAPFYNSEKYLDRFLKSVIAQTYNAFQFILVNDGSTDKSDIIVEKYAKDLHDKCDFMYIHQRNGGAASAVNNALKYVKGEYLSWADCDDELHPSNLEAKSDWLDKHPDYGLVLCQAKVFDEVSRKESILDITKTKKGFEEDMFEHIFLDGIPVYTGVFMIRSKLLFEKLDNRNIYYNPEAGQNYQLLLPAAYNSKCGLINKYLYTYYIRPESHSHNTNFRKEWKRLYIREKLLREVLSFLDEYKKNIYMQIIHKECAIKRFELAFNGFNKGYCNCAYSTIKLYDILSKKIWLKHFIINNRLLSRVYKLMKGKK